MGKDKDKKKTKKAKTAGKGGQTAAAASSGTSGVDLKQAAAQVVELAKSPAVRELAVAALGAAAAKIAESTEARRKSRGAGDATGDGGERLREQAVHLGEVIKAAALEGARQLIEELDGSPGKAGRRRKKDEVSRPGPGADE